jgi:hypothetical protein
MHHYASAVPAQGQQMPHALLIVHHCSEVTCTPYGHLSDLRFSLAECLAGSSCFLLCSGQLLPQLSST